MSASAAVSRQRTFNLLVLAAVILLLLRVVSVYHRGLGPSLGWTARLLDDQVITNVEAGSPAAHSGLQVGDKLVGFDQLSHFALPEQKARLINSYRAMRVGESYQLKVVRDGRVVDLRISSHYYGPAGLRLNIIHYHGIALIYLLFAVTILLLKPYHQQAMLFSAFMMSLSACYIPALSSRLPVGLGAVVDMIQYAFIFATPYLFIQFMLSFPQRLVADRRYERILYWLYALLVLQTVVYLGTKFVDLHAPVVYHQAPRLDWLRHQAFNLFYVVFLAAILIGAACLFLHLRRASHIQDKRRVRLILLGMVIGLPPIVFLNGLARFMGLPVTTPAALMAGLLSLTFPLAFGYAIVKHRVMDVRLILRRSVKYLFISRLVLALEAITLVVLLYYFISPMLQRLGGRISTTTLIIYAGISYSLISFLMGRAHAKLMPILDRLFFHDAYSTEKILIQLTQALTSVKEQGTLLKLVAGELMRAIHVERVAFLLPEPRWVTRPGPRKNGELARPAVDLGCWTARSQSGSVQLQCESEEDLSATCQFLKKLYQQGTPMEVDGEDQTSWVHHLPDAEQKLLTRLQANLLVPLKQSNNLFGVMSLGEKRSQLPYTPDDVQLLLSVAAQMTIALEKIWLLRTVIQQERWRREMEIARLVQRNSFPDAPTDLATLEIAGVCLTAQSVGGDYYDFIRISPDQLGIAIGDVSGKGISAALIMSSLQASLRSLASADRHGVTDMITTVNKLLCRSTASDKFATFFYGLYDDGARTLTYVNAGHNPPFLVRCSSASTNGIQNTPPAFQPRIVHLRQGGMVLGVTDDCLYEQETIGVAPGDLLIGYTDGITEARNEQDQEYGEERLEKLVSQHGSLSAGALQQRILEDVHQFISGTEQRDDITLIVVKVR